MSFFLEMTGIVAFAISGALVGIQKKMDIFGVIILGMTTAIGGGMIRDVFLGIIPPTSLVTSAPVPVSLVTSIVVFIPQIRNLIIKIPKVYDLTLLIFDSIGLGVFTVVGANACINNIPDCNVFLPLFYGVLTGVGGGVIRDVLSGEIPFIFSHYFYASAALIGALVFSVSIEYLPVETAMILGEIVIVALRLLAAKYKWNLPRA